MLGRRHHGGFGGRRAFETKPSRKIVTLKAARGGEMGHYGEKEVTCRDKPKETSLDGVKFLATDVPKPVLAVRRLIERGNVVQFGPEPEHSYIMNIRSGKKIMMERKGGSFVIKADFAQGFRGHEGFARQAR